ETARAEAELETVRQIRLRGAKDTALALGDPDGARRAAEVERVLAEREQAAYVDRREIAGRRRTAERDLAAAREALEAAGRGGPASHQVSVGLAAQTPGNVELTVSYLVAGASWTPLYDIRVPQGDAEVSVDYSASVSQTTGEDWPELALLLSTARPGVTRELP